MHCNIQSQPTMYNKFIDFYNNYLKKSYQWYFVIEGECYIVTASPLNLFLIPRLQLP